MTWGEVPSTKPGGIPFSWDGSLLPAELEKPVPWLTASCSLLQFSTSFIPLFNESVSFQAGAEVLLPHLLYYAFGTWPLLMWLMHLPRPRLGFKLRQRTCFSVASQESLPLVSGYGAPVSVWRLTPVPPAGFWKHEQGRAVLLPFPLLRILSP